MATLEQLQQQLDALTQRVDAITAPPTDYYTQRWSGEETDRGVGIALGLDPEGTGILSPEHGGTGAETTQEALAKLGAGVRPNMFVNPYFLVNQRGKSSYAGDGMYGIDGWKNYVSLDWIKGGPITLTGQGNTIQIFDKDSNPIVSRANTLSFLASGSIHFVLQTTKGCVAYASINSSKISLGHVTYVLEENEEFVDFTLQPQDSNPAHVYAVKLEEGEGQTLARQDYAGNWNILTQPDMDYGTQLAKCQAFYEESNENVASRGVSIRVPPNGIIYVPFKVPKRVIPAITVQGNDASYIQTSYITLNGFTAQNSDTVNLRAFDYSATAEL